MINRKYFVIIMITLLVVCITSVKLYGDVGIPTGSIVINNGEDYTNSNTFTLTLSAIDDVGVTGYYISTGSSKPSSGNSGWEYIATTTNYTAQVSYVCQCGDGYITLYVWYKDEDGNISNTANDSITLDTEEPFYVNIKTPTDEPTYSTENSTLTATGDAYDTDTGVETVTWSNDRGGEGTAIGTNSWSISKIDLSSGVNIITVTATDYAGNSLSDLLTVACNAPATPTPIPTTTPTPRVETGIVAGFITDEDTGLAIASAIVKDRTGSYTGKSDASGYYQIDNIPAGKYVFTVTAIGYNSKTRTNVTVEANETTTLDFALLFSGLSTPIQTPTPTSSPTPVAIGYVKGTVYDAFTSEGISGATISTNKGNYSTTTDQNGAYQLKASSGQYTITASASGYFSASQTVTVKEGVTALIDFDLSPATTGSISGYTEEDDGDVLPDVTITLSGNSSNYSAKTDKDGYFKIEDIEPGEYQLTFEKETYATQTYLVTIEAGEETDFGITVMEKIIKGMIYGKVKDDCGEPIKSAKVKCEADDFDTIKTKTDDDGYFEFEDLTTGQYTIKVAKKGYKSQTEIVDFEDDEQVKIVFELEDKNPKYDLSGSWKGKFSSNLMEESTINIDLESQYCGSSKYTGDWTTSRGGEGTIKLKYKNDKITFTLKSTAKRCKGTFSGEATYISGKRIEFTFYGEDCLGSHKNGEGYVEKKD